MKKIFVTLLIIGAAFTTFGQVRVGIRVAPGIGLNGVHDKISANQLYSKGKTSFAFTVGPEIDIFLNDRIAFCTGLWWSARKVSLEVSDPFLISTASYTSSLQYIQLPLTFKAYTNEITSGMKIYAQLGTMFEVKISDKLKESSPAFSPAIPYVYEKWYQYVNLGIYAAAGTEFTVNDNNAFYAGIFYQRGLINQARNYKNSFVGTQNEFAKQAKVNLSSIGLEVGFKF